MQLETGSGKTALSFVIACNAHTKGLKVLLINVSEELTFRDFLKSGCLLSRFGDPSELS